MKTLILLTVGVVSLTALTLNVSADQPLQSPRAKAADAKIVTVSTAADTAADTRAPGVSPRAHANQAKAVKGTTDSANTTAKCRVVGSPKELANRNSTPGTCCCGTSTASCRMATSCCAMN